MAELKDFFKIRAGAHYYGDIVRALFLAGAILMAISLPFLNSVLPVPAYASIFIIIAIGLIAGLTNPVQKWVIASNVLISFVAFVSFEYYAIYYFSKLNFSLVFIINQILALIFFVAMYYSIKSLRGSFMDKKQD